MWWFVKENSGPNPVSRNHNIYSHVTYVGTLAHALVFHLPYPLDVAYNPENGHCIYIVLSNIFAPTLLLQSQ